MIIQFIMKFHRQTSIAAMYQPRRACMQMLKLDAKHIMCAMMDARDIKEPHFCAPMEPFSIRKNSLAIGGIMWTALKHLATISKYFWDEDL